MQDFLTDEKGDLIIKDGHFLIGECTNQNKRSLYLAQKGEYRQYPSTGIGIQDVIDSEDLDELPSLIQKEFEDDGIKIKTLEVFEDGTINDDSKYES